jgi:hypothetical protein
MVDCYFPGWPDSAQDKCSNRSAMARYVARSEQGERLVYHLDGQALLDPAPRHPTHVKWHSDQVFKSSA